jgi:hypothetical protein
MRGQSHEHTLDLDARPKSISSSRAEAASRGAMSTFPQRMIGDTSEFRHLSTCPERTRPRRPGLRIKAAVKAHGDGATRRRLRVAARVGASRVEPQSLSTPSDRNSLSVVISASRFPGHAPYRRPLGCFQPLPKFDPSPSWRPALVDSHTASPSKTTSVLYDPPRPWFRISSCRMCPPITLYDRDAQPGTRRTSYSWMHMRGKGPVMNGVELYVHMRCHPSSDLVLKMPPLQLRSPVNVGELFVGAITPFERGPERNASS